MPAARLPLPLHMDGYGLSAAEQWHLKRMAPRLFNALWLLCVGCHLAASVSGDGDTAGDDLGDGGLASTAGRAGLRGGAPDDDDALHNYTRRNMRLMQSSDSAAVDAAAISGEHGGGDRPELLGP